MPNVYERFPWKDPSPKGSSCFYGDHPHFPPAQHAQWLSNSSFPLQPSYWVGVYREEGWLVMVAVGINSSFCHLLINVKKRTDSRVGNSSDTLFRVPGPQSPPLWVLVANCGVTGKGPTQISCRATTKKKRKEKQKDQKSSWVGGKARVTSSFILRQWRGFPTTLSHSVPRHSGS